MGGKKFWIFLIGNRNSGLKPEGSILVILLYCLLEGDWLFR